jgi:hypothetical protein
MILTKKDLRQLIELMNECWNENPNVRLNALLVKKKLSKIFQSL